MVNTSPENRLTNEKYWDSIWTPLDGNYHNLHVSDFYFGRKGLFTKLIQNRIGDISGKTVLELGGGGNNYRLLSMAKWSGALVTALDFSAEGLKVVNDLFKINTCKASFIQDDILNWQPKEPNVNFDVVTHWGVLEHFIDPKPMLKKSFEALNPGGSLIFSMPNMEAFAARYWQKWCPDSWSKHIFHSTELIQATLSELGFTYVECFYFGVPCIKAANWETKSPLQPSLDLIQKILSASARIFPVYHKLGHRRISMERGFFARKGP